MSTVGDPVCGNGIREGDEICDCGSEEVNTEFNLYTAGKKPNSMEYAKYWQIECYSILVATRRAWTFHTCI